MKMHWLIEGWAMWIIFYLIFFLTLVISSAVNNYIFIIIILPAAVIIFILFYKYRQYQLDEIDKEYVELHTRKKIEY